jgi:phage tail tape-measure protein
VSASSRPAVTPASGAAARVLALVNQARAAAGLPLLTITAGLDASASARNVTMAGGCGLSHQCPGEPDLGARETAAGVTSTARGENIGEGGPVADTTATIAQMAAGLTQAMLNESHPTTVTAGTSSAVPSPTSASPSTATPPAPSGSPRTSPTSLRHSAVRVV